VIIIEDKVELLKALAPLHIALIAVPLTIQTFFIFIVAYGWAKAWKLPHSVAAPVMLALVKIANKIGLEVITSKPILN